MITFIGILVWIFFSTSPVITWEPLYLTNWGIGLGICLCLDVLAWGEVK